MRWICSIWLLVLLVASGEAFAFVLPTRLALSSAITFAYDGHNQSKPAYDGRLESTIGYDAVLEHITEETRNETTGNRVLFAKFAELVAAKTGADSALQGARLGEHLRQLEKYGQAGFKELESGRLRYYGNINPATTPGTMAGRRLVREWDPSTGAARTWHETVDQAGRVRIVRPETGGSKVHYMFDEHGNYTGSF